MKQTWSHTREKRRIIAVEDQWSFTLQLQLALGGPSSETNVIVDRKRWVVEEKGEARPTLCALFGLVL